MCVCGGGGGGCVHGQIHSSKCDLLKQGYVPFVDSKHTVQSYLIIHQVSCFDEVDKEPLTKLQTASVPSVCTQEVTNDCSRLLVYAHTAHTLH